MLSKLTRLTCALAIGGVALTGCAEQPSDHDDVTHGAAGSRAHLYGSTPELTADSDVVIVGAVKDSRVVADVTPDTEFTLATVMVEQVVKGELKRVGQVIVRQLGTTQEPGPATLLKPGDRYLLFLTASGLDGALASQFYVTGGTAGIYRTNEPVAPQGVDASKRGQQRFHKVQADPDDHLPAWLTPEAVADQA